MEQQICLWCREDTSFGTGKFVNRIPASKQDSIDDEYETGYQCADCQAEECSVCKQSVIEYSFTENCDAICYECNPDEDEDYVYDRECDDCGAKTCAEVAYFYEDKTFCEDCCPDGYGE
jgi:hypothetical protein